MSQNVLHQVKTLGKPLDGMSYVIQSDNGQTLVIDGGMGPDGRGLFDYLCSLQNTQSPVVDLWILTHSHADHTYAFLEAVKAYGERLQVKEMAYRFPQDGLYASCHEAEGVEDKQLVEEARARLGARHWEPSAGDKRLFGGLELEVLYTCADLPHWENAPILQNVNDTSLVFRLTCDGQTVLFLGDVEAAADRVLIDRYGSALKSDVVQLAHHGEISSTEEFYRLIDPTIVLWPGGITLRDRLVVTPLRANRYLFYESNVEDFYIAGEGTVALPLPLSVRETPNKGFLPKERNRPVELSFSVPYAHTLPDLNAVEDPAWLQAPERPFSTVLTQADPSARVTYRLLWQEQALYLQARYTKNAFVPDSKNTASHLCNLLKLYYTDRAYTDVLCTWEEVTDLSAFQIKMYTHDKQTDGAYTHPELCRVVRHPVEGGFVFNCRIPFRQEKQAGDTVGFVLEANGVAAPGQWRNFRGVSTQDHLVAMRFVHGPAWLDYLVLQG